jgi:hypothetical protein
MNRSELKSLLTDKPGDWPCPKCGNINEHQAVKCEFCNHGAVVELFQGNEPPCESCQRLRVLAGEMANYLEAGVIMEPMAYVKLEQRLKDEGVGTE